MKNWYVCNSPLSDGTMVVADEVTGNTIAHCFGDDAKENAQVISAALELLQACEWALTELTEPDTCTGDTLADTQRKLRDAINKAKGVNINY